jgi:hypothetical protein
MTTLRAMSTHPARNAVSMPRSSPVEASPPNRTANGLYPNIQHPNIQQISSGKKWSGDWYLTSCIIILGDTGLGKSTILNLCTGNNAETSNEAEHSTKRNKIYNDVTHGSNYPKWMDTVGLNDTRDEPNFTVFQDFLRKMKQRNLTSVHAIIWAVSPNIRGKRVYHEQALQIETIFKGIDANQKDNEEVDIWKNVILLCEKSFRGERSFQGAKDAIKQFSKSGDNIRCVQMEDFGIDEEGKAILHSEEAIRTRDLLMTALGDIQSPIYLYLKNNMVCRDCGQTGDPRLMDLKCHWKPEKKWNKAPNMFDCGNYMEYMSDKNKLVCGNEQCFNSRMDRSAWSKKACFGWKYTEGNYRTCADVLMLGSLNITRSVSVANETMSGNEIKFKTRHNLEEM